MMSHWLGVSVSEHDEYAIYEGKLEALLGTGLFKREWFPGQPGNGKGSSTYVFIDERQLSAIIKKPGDGTALEYGFGRVRIQSTGAPTDPLFRAWLRYPPAVLKRRKLEREACTRSEEWQAAKVAHADKSGAIARWRNAINTRIGEILMLCTGEVYFSEMPDVRIKGDDLARVRDAVETLKHTFALTTPEIPDVIVRSNVYSIRDGVHRGLKKTC